VVDTARWLIGRKVLISPLSVRAIDWQARSVAVDLSRQQIEDSPGIDSDKPVTRQHEHAYFDYFGYPYYWAGPLRWGPVAFPPGDDAQGADAKGADAKGADATQRAGPDYWWEQQRRTFDEKGDPHLRSTEAVSGYHIEALDGEIGHVQDFLFHERDWSLRFLAVDTRNWLPGRHVLVGIDWLEHVDWSERKVHVSMTRDAIRRAPEWQPELALVGQDEDYLHARTDSSFQALQVRD